MVAESILHHAGRRHGVGGVRRHCPRSGRLWNMSPHGGQFPSGGLSNFFYDACDVLMLLFVPMLLVLLLLLH